MIKSVVRAALRPVDLVLTRVVRAVALKEEASGVAVLVLDDDRKEDRVQRIAAAISRLDSFAPWRSAHLRRDVEAILVARHTNRLAGRVILLSRKTIDESEPDWLALHLVYFGTLLRLPRPHGQSSGMRRLRLAFEEQLAFARRLPDYGFYVSHLTQAWDNGWWMQAKDRHIRVIRESGMPGWFQRFAVWLNR